MEEREIVRMLMARQDGAMEHLMAQYGALVRYIVAPIVAGDAAREDCIGEIYARVWEKIEMYDAARGSLKTWISAIARHAAVDFARRAQSEVAGEELDEQIPSAEPGPEEILLTRERQDEIRKFLAALPTGERVLLWRKYYYRQTTAQIAAELGMTERSVEGKLYRLRRRLREQMGGDGNA